MQWQCVLLQAGPSSAQPLVFVRIPSFMDAWMAGPHLPFQNFPPPLPLTSRSPLPTVVASHPTPLTSCPMRSHTIEPGLVSLPYGGVRTLQESLHIPVGTRRQDCPSITQLQRMVFWKAAGWASQLVEGWCNWQQCWRCFIICWRRQDTTRACNARGGWRVSRGTCGRDGEIWWLSNRRRREANGDLGEMMEI